MKLKRLTLLIAGIGLLFLAGCKNPEEDDESKPNSKVKKYLYNFSTSVGTEKNPLNDAQQFVLNMGLGWNLGNTLDAHIVGQSGLKTENCWGQPTTTEKMIKDLVENGINTIRIPVTWHNHLSDENYTIDSEWMARVKEIVDWSMDSGMYVILNIHHDDAYYKKSAIGYGEGFYPLEKDKEESEKFLSSVWTQVGNTFKNYGEKLIFETMNEPRLRAGTDGSHACATGNHEWWLNQNCSTCLEAERVLREYNQLCIDTIRGTGGNNGTIRYISCPNLCASPDAAFHLVADENGNKKTQIELLKDTVENRLIQAIHMYTPYDFAMGYPGDTEFTDAHKETLSYYFNNIMQYFISKGYPVIIGETGATDKDNLEARAHWYAMFTGFTKSISATCCIWDNGNSVPGNEAFAFYNRRSQTFTYPLLLDVAVEQTKLTTEVVKNNMETDIDS